MLTVLSFVCPPLAVLLIAPSSVPKTIALTLLLFVPGVLHARKVVEEQTAAARYARLQSILAARDADSVRVPVSQAA